MRYASFKFVTIISNEHSGSHIRMGSESVNSIAMPQWSRTWVDGIKSQCL